MNFRRKAQIQQALLVKQIHAPENSVVGGAFEFQAPLEFEMDQRESPACEVVVDVVTDGLQFVLGDVVFHLNDLVADQAVARDDDH